MKAKVIAHNALGAVSHAAMRTKATLQKWNAAIKLGRPDVVARDIMFSIPLMGFIALTSGIGWVGTTVAGAAMLVAPPGLIAHNPLWKVVAWAGIGSAHLISAAVFLAAAGVLVTRYDAYCMRKTRKTTRANRAQEQSL